MTRDNWPGHARNKGVASQKKQTVLILDQNSVPCAADKCNHLLDALQRSLPIRCVQEEKENLRPDYLPFVPDLILLRVSVNKAAQNLILPSKRMWSCAAIIAVFCLGSYDPVDNFSYLFTKCR